MSERERSGGTRIWTSLAVAVAIALVGCGGVSTTSDGAPGQDGQTADARSGADAPTPDAAPRIVTVTVYTPNGGERSIGTPVVFHNPDGSVLSTKDTDEAGQATEIIEPGAAVTAVIRAWTVESPYPWLQSATGLTGGEEVVLGNARPPYVESKLLGRMIVNLPPAPTLGATMLSRTECSAVYHGVVVSSSLELYSTCPNPFALLSTASSASGGELTHYTFRKGVPFTPDGTVTQPAWRSDFATTTFNLSGFPVSSRNTGFTATALLGGMTFPMTSAYVDLTGVTATSMVARVPNGFADRVRHDLYVYADDGYSQVTWTRAAPPTTQAVNVTAEFLPFVSNAAETAGVITFTTRGGTASADLTLANMSWSDDESYGIWDLMAPGDATSIRLPTLPAALRAHGPSTTALTSASAGQLEFDAWPDYPTALREATRPGALEGIVNGTVDGVFKSSLNQFDR